MPDQSVKVAMCQIKVEASHPEENFARADAMLRSAAQMGARIAVLPECFDLGWANPEAETLAQPIPGPRAAQLSAWAKELSLYICAGLTERAGEKLYNTAVLYDDQGALLGVHRKINILTDVEGLYDVGDRLCVYHTPLGAIGMDICADNAASSAVLAESLCRMGARIILSPCSWAVPPDCRRAYYGGEWYAPYSRLAKLYGVPVVGVSNVGKVTAGAWAGWSCIGSSIALFPDGVSGTTLPYGEEAACLRVLDVPLRAPALRGTALSQEVARRAAALQ
jgi:predicted amidohydrolase